MRARLRFPRLWCAPALLLLYQAAPRPFVDEVGRLRLALGVTRGGYRDEEFDCAGNLTRSSPVRYHSVSGQAEAWLGAKLRLAGAVGRFGGSSDSLLDLRTATFGSVILAYEGAKLGLGGGVAHWPERFGGSGPIPALYLRIGRVDKMHFRVDENASAAPGMPPGYRVGIGSGYGPSRETRWFLGLNAYPFGNNDGVSFGGELGLPLRAPVQPMLQAALGSKSQWTLGVGLSATIGQPR